MKTNIIVVAFLLAFSGQAGFSQPGIPYLERVLTINFNHERLDASLKRVSQQAGFTFSYSPAILEADRVINYTFVNKTVREILDQLFGGTVKY